MKLTCFVSIAFQLIAIGLCRGQHCKTDAKSVVTSAEMRASIQADPAKKLVALQQLIPGLVVDMRYATINNFTHTVLYHHPVALLRTAPANGLRLVQEDLRKKGYALKLFDAFRPLSATCTIWRLVPDRHYAANPRKGSNHNRCLAVDVTLIDLRTGRELDMGTAFDNFTDSAHHDFYTLPAQVLTNRRLLKQTMRKYGFGMVPTEWWHYQWHNDRDYEVIDLDFDELKYFY